MKKSILFIALLVCVLCQAGAQNEINFTAVHPDQQGLSDEVKDGLKQKVEQILGRNNAGATSVYNAFVIQPELVVLESKSTEGLINNVTLVSGELTLTAKNLYDESIYGTVVMTLEGDAKGNQDAALKALMRNIKATNPAFTRFIRTTRERIMDHYMENCQTILTKAQTLIATDQIRQAMGYLGSVPEVVPCYEDVASMMALTYSHAKTLDCDEKLLMARSKYVMGKYEEALELVADIPSSSTCSDAARTLTDSIQKYISIPPQVIEVERIVEVEKVVEVDRPVVVERVVEVEKPAERAPKSDGFVYRLNISSPELGFEIFSCNGDASSRSIMIYCQVINKAKGGSRYIRMIEAIDVNGGKYTNVKQSSLNGCSTDSYNNMPTDIPVSKCFVIGDITHKLDKLAYVEIKVDNHKIELRDVPVSWK